MRFLLLTQYFHPEIGATQVRLASITRELLRLGHQVEIVTAVPNYPEGKIVPNYQGHFYLLESWEGIPLHRVWIYAATGAGGKRLLNYFSFMLTAFWGLRQTQRPDYIVVESPPLFLGITAYLAAKRWQVPWILNIADLWPDSVRALGLVKEGMVLTLAEKLEAWLYRRANLINVVTEGLREILIHQKQVPSQKILFLPNGVDTQIFAPQPVDDTWQNHLGLPNPNQPIFLYTGTHGYAHGMEVILQAAELLKETPVLFLLVGGGSDKSRLEQLSKAKALTNVLFWPSQPPAQIARLYSLARAGISTLQSAPLFDGTRPVKILATMACAKPVIYSGRGEGARMVQQAKAGLVIPPQDPVALAEAVRYIINHPHEATELGQNGRIYVEAHLQWSTVVSAWLQQLSDTQQI